MGLFGTSSKVEELEQRNASLVEKNKKLRAEIANFGKDQKALSEAHEDELHDLKREHARTVEKKSDQIDDLNDEVIKLQASVKNLKSIANDSAEVEAKTIATDKREYLLTAKEKAFGTFEEAIKKAEDKAEEVGKQQYQAGYADGAADGLRKAHEITAEDRKQANSIALIAAAGHSTSASEQIGAVVAKQLEAGGVVSVKPSTRKK